MLYPDSAHDPISSVTLVFFGFSPEVAERQGHQEKGHPTFLQAHDAHPGTLDKIDKKQPAVFGNRLPHLRLASAKALAHPGIDPISQNSLFS
jgi:hypothetical protein